MKQSCLIYSILMMFNFSCKSIKPADKIDTKEEVDIVSQEDQNIDESSIDSNLISIDTIYFTTIDTIQFELQNDFSMGKSWNIIQNSDSLSMINQRMVQKVEDGHPIDFQKFRFLSMPEGTYTLIFENKRPFGVDTVNVKKHSQIIIIKE